MSDNAADSTSAGNATLVVVAAADPLPNLVTSNGSSKALLDGHDKQPKHAGLSEEVITFAHEHHLSFRVDTLTVETLANMVKNEQHKLLARFGGTKALAAKLDCDNTSAGLPATFDFQTRREEFGYNEIEKQKLPSYFSLILDGLQDVIMLMLIAAAVVSLILGLAFDENKSIAWVEGAAILLVVVIVLNVQAGTDYSKTATFRKQQLELENGKKVIAMRGGKEVEMHPNELVVGDVLKCRVGDILAADGVLVDGNVKIDESSLTGESNLMEKAPFDYEGPSGVETEVPKPAKSPFVLSGTSVMFGSGLILVLAVGCNSVQGLLLFFAHATRGARMPMPRGRANTHRAHLEHCHQHARRQSSCVGHRGCWRKRRPRRR